jgi:hypothetical protein
MFANYFHPWSPNYNNEIWWLGWGSLWDVVVNDESALEQRYVDKKQNLYMHTCKNLTFAMY